MWRFDRRQPPASPYIKPDHPGPDTGAGAGASTGAGARGPAASTGARQHWRCAQVVAGGRLAWSTSGGYQGLAGAGVGASCCRTIVL